MPFINVSTYLISDACVLLAVEREREQRDKGARRGSEYPKPQSWGCQCVQRCWSTDLSISVHLGCKGFFVFWRVFFVQHVRSCTSVFLYFFWISADVQKASSSARWKLLLSRIVLKRFCFSLCYFCSNILVWMRSRADTRSPRSAEMMRIRGRSVSLCELGRPLSTHWEKRRRGEPFPVSRITFHRWLSDWSELRKTEGGVGRVDVRLKQKRKEKSRIWMQKGTATVCGYNCSRDFQ